MWLSNLEKLRQCTICSRSKTSITNAMTDIVVVGSCMIDLISYVPRLPKLGETLIAQKFQIGFGGKGANQCIAASNIGAKCSMIAKVGDDAFGQNYVENFKNNNISTDHVKMTEKAPTGTAPIAVNPKGENSIIIAPGANLFLTKEDVIAAEHLIQNTKVVVCQFEINTDVTLEALKIARKHNVTTIVNPAPANADIPPEMYSNADYFCPNETETEILTGKPVKNVDDAKAAANDLLQRGCKNVIVTLGENGSFYTGQHGSNIHIPAIKVDVFDTTGAGDAYIGALAYYLACYPKLDIKTILTRAGIIATKSVQRPGTQPSYAKRTELPDVLFI